MTTSNDWGYDDYDDSSDHSDFGLCFSPTISYSTPLISSRPQQETNTSVVRGNFNSRQRVCRFFRQGQDQTKCHFGSLCRDCHVTTLGRCYRCGEILKLSEIDEHCDEGCRLNLDLDLREENEIVAPTITQQTRQLPSSSTRYTTSTSAPTSATTVSGYSDLCTSLNALSLSLSAASASPAPAAGRRTEVPPASTKVDPCYRLLDGLCFKGAHCYYPHFSQDDRCLLCNVLCYSQIEKDIHTQRCTEFKLMQEEIRKTSETECPICLSRLSEIQSCPTNPSSSSSSPHKPKICHKNFALLPDCGHLFCIKCIFRWRETSENDPLREMLDPTESSAKGKYCCPICRSSNEYIIPSNRVISDPERRKREVVRHSEMLKRSPCKFYKYKQGGCFSGSKCRFGHLDNDGYPVSLEEANSNVPIRKKKGRTTAAERRIDQFLTAVRRSNYYLDSVTSSEDDDDDDIRDRLYLGVPNSVFLGLDNHCNPNPGRRRNES